MGFSRFSPCMGNGSVLFREGEGKKACLVLKNNLSGGSQGSFKTKFVSLNNGRIKENQGKMSKIPVEKSGKIMEFFSQIRVAALRFLTPLFRSFILVIDKKQLQFFYYQVCRF